MQKLRSGNENGFTLIELMIVIAIVGILAAIAIPNFIEYRKRGCNSQANSDIKNLYTSCQAYFTDYPTGCFTLDAATSAGFKQSGDLVKVEIDPCTADNLKITVCIECGDKYYVADSSGKITTSDDDNCPF